VAARDASYELLKGKDFGSGGAVRVPRLKVLAGMMDIIFTCLAHDAEEGQVLGLSQ
jgi:hypothetical protein